VRLRRPAELRGRGFLLWISILALGVLAPGLGCDGPILPRNAAAQRHARLREALARRTSDPLVACQLFADAGPGADLEGLRLRKWLECLEAAKPPPKHWRKYLSATPSPRLRSRAELGLARSLMQSGAAAEALELLKRAAARGVTEAAEELLATSDVSLRETAARQLAVDEPWRLRRHDSTLDTRLLKALAPSERLERAVAWRRQGNPRRAASELRSVRWSGEDEQRRRVELAQAEIARGSPSRALQVLPSVGRSSFDALVVRGEALRRRGWSRSPGRRARQAFVACFEAANRAESRAEERSQRLDAGELALECATEARRLIDALAAWDRLARDGWTSSRRGWLGRRLGVELAASGDPRFRPAVDRLTASLPSHERCLRFWRSHGAGVVSPELGDLAAAVPADLYGQWSRRILGDPPTTQLSLASPAGVGDLPPSVALLLAWGESAEASREWRRIRGERSVTDVEAVTAAAFESNRGRRDLAVGWLRAARPELSSVALGESPSDMVRLYVPLAFSEDLIAAARKVGVEPWWIAGLARQESLFHPRARSPRGAMGVLQLIPSTAGMHARALGFGSRPDLHDPAVNLTLGARELASLIDRFGAMEPALAAYNAGETRVRRWWKQWPDRQLFTERIPIPETYNYVRRVTFLADSYRLVWSDAWKEARR